MFVYRSLPKTVGLLLLAIVLIGASALLAVVGWGLPSGTVQVTIGAVGVVFFSVGAVRVAQQLVRREVVVEITAEGVRDVRLSERMIPWSAVRNVHQIKVHRGQLVVLDLTTAFERDYVAGASRMMRRISSGTDFTGIPLSVTGLSTRAEDLYDAVVRNWQAAEVGSDVSRD